MKLFVQYADTVSDVVHLEMWDLDLPNHLAGHKRKLLQLKFRNVKDLIAVRQVRSVPALISFLSVVTLLSCLFLCGHRK